MSKNELLGDPSDGQQGRTYISEEITLKQRDCREKCVPMTSRGVTANADKPQLCGTESTSTLPLNPNPYEKMVSSSGFLLLKSV